MITIIITDWMLYTIATLMLINIALDLWIIKLRRNTDDKLNQLQEKVQLLKKFH